MSWNYRVVVDANGISLAEVYYNEEGVPKDYSLSVLDCHVEKEDLEESYKLMASAFEKPVLKVVDGKLEEME